MVELAAGENPLAQSDEDIMGMTPPTLEAPASDEGGDPVVLPLVPETPAAPATPAVVVPPAAGEADVLAEGEDDDGPIIGGLPEAFKKPKKDPVDPAAASAGDPKDPKPAGEVVPLADAGQVQSWTVPQTIRANGKDIVLKSEAEAIGLMQMGANYTRKMQELKPQQNLLQMLQNNGLVDEGKLSFLIDLHNKDPQAIAKLVKDAGIDPLDINTEQSDTYRPSNYSVSDEEANFRSMINEIASTDKGTETVAEINTKWDSVSKEVIWKNPEIISIIHAQRENGVYNLITTEMDRRITLGQIPTSTPFLEAYKTVGDEMSKAALEAGGGNAGGATPPNGQPAPASATAAPVPVATRVATPKSVVKDSDRAAAASQTRSSPAVNRQVINPLAMSDEDFMKTMEGRL